MEIEKIVEIAKKKTFLINEEREKDYFQKALAVTIKAGFLKVNFNYNKNLPLPTIEEIEKAGLIEPRFFEVLPALLIHYPAYIVPTDNLPKDLLDIRNGNRPDTFRGLNYKQWI